MRHAPVVMLFALTGALASGCGQGGTSTAPPPVSTPAPTSQPTPTWHPSIPDRPVDPASVERDYTPVLSDAVRAAAAGIAAQGGSLRPSPATVATERFDDVCVVKVEQPVTVSSISEPEPLKKALSAAVARHGFADLDFANDPGGAIRFIAHDSRGALFEFRSKGETTLAVRVATADSACSG